MEYALESSAIYGWNQKMLEDACAYVGRPHIDKMLFPEGIREFTMAFFDEVDHEMFERCSQVVAKGDGVSSRIASHLKSRFAILSRYRDAVMQILHYFASKDGALCATILGWRTVDRIWHASDAHSYSKGYYTKRASLLAIYSAAMLHFAKNGVDIEGFIDNKIEKLMRFHAFKGKVINFVKKSAFFH